MVARESLVLFVLKWAPPFSRRALSQGDLEVEVVFTAAQGRTGTRGAETYQRGVDDHHRARWNVVEHLAAGQVLEAEDLPVATQQGSLKFRRLAKGSSAKAMSRQRRGWLTWRRAPLRSCGCLVVSPGRLPRR